jgi:hypothetical protein
MTPKRTPEPLPIAEDSRGALLMPPSPPEPGTIRVLIGQGCTWTTRELPGATQLDIKLVPSTARHVRGGPR